MPIALIGLKLLGWGKAFAAWVRSWPWWAWAGLGCVLLLLVSHHIGYGSGKADQRTADAKTIAALQRDLATERGNVVTLRKAVADQNVAAAALGADSAARQKAGQDALRKAQEREKAAQGSIAALERAGRSTGRAGAPCPISKVNRDALEWL